MTEKTLVRDARNSTNFTLKTLVIGLVLCLCGEGFALDSKDIATVEAIVKRHNLEKGLGPQQLFQGYAILARELEAYGHPKKASEYYLKAMKANPKDERLLEVATSYLSNLFRQDPPAAKNYFQTSYLDILKKSKSPMKNDFKEFWENVFKEKKEKVDSKNHRGFYGQFFKERDVKELVEKEKLYEAFALLSPKGLESRDINSQLQYDTLSFLNGKKKGFFCSAMLKKYPNSPSVPVEICRYLKSGKIKYGDLKELNARAKKELPHLSYLVEALQSGGKK